MTEAEITFTGNHYACSERIEGCAILAKYTGNAPIHEFGSKYKDRVLAGNAVMKLRKEKAHD